MKNINKNSDELLEAVQMTGVECEELADEVERFKILEGIISKYTNKTKYTYSLWEDFTDKLSVNQEYAWEWFEDLLMDKEVILFFEKDNDARMFTFKNGGQLKQVLENCYKFIFYITDRKLSFILSYNDHNYLIACGEAKQWLQNFKVIKEKKLILYSSSS